MTQKELFDIGYAPVTGRITFGVAAKTPAPPLPAFAPGSETSRQAAIAKYDAGSSPSQREMIYRLIMFAGDKGQTREEIAEKLDLSGDTVRPRICELLGAAKGWPDALIKRSGKTRATKSGLKAEVLVVTNDKK